MGKPGGPAGVVRIAVACLVSATALLVLLLSGCAGTPADSPAAAGDPVLAVVTTGSAAESRGQLPRSVGAGLLELALQSRVPGGATVVLLAPGQPPALYDLTPLRGDQAENASRQRVTKANANVAAFEAAVAAAEASEPGLDLLGLLDRAGRQYPGTPIVALSSGVSTEDPLDLRRLGWPDGTAWVVDELRALDALPQYLIGRHVTFFYLGDTAGTQAKLPPALRKTVGELYVAVCLAAQAARCEVKDDPPSEIPPSATAAVPVVDVPVIGTPEPGPTPCEQVVAVPAVLLFEPDSSVLAPGADTVLAPFADQIRDSREGLVITEIAGHSADVGSGDGVELSQRRAQAVADRLRQLGVPAADIRSVVGRGELEPVAPNRNPDGSRSPLATRNRRVTITSSTCQLP